jgi:serine/threonine-protein kinase
MAKGLTIPNVGETLAGRYVVEEQIGRGGFGVVFKATQLGMQRTVALKTLLPSAMVQEDRVERFRREAMLARNLNHPNTIRLYDFGQTDGGLLFIAMEFLDGRPLSQRGIIHRDLKPANIMVMDIAGEQDFVKVLDFGIAKIFDPHDKGNDENNQLTKAGVGFGTAYYMAPEQIRNKNICPATDLYALGLVMVEMLTGEVVYKGNNSMDVALKQLSADPPPIPAWVLRGPLGSVIQRATQKSAELRFPSAVEMLRDLRAVDTHASLDVSTQVATLMLDAIKPGTLPVARPDAPTVPATPAVPVAPPAPPQRGGLVWFGAVVAALAIMVIVGSLGYLGYQRWKAKPAEPVVQAEGDKKDGDAPPKEPKPDPIEPPPTASKDAGVDAPKSEEKPAVATIRAIINTSPEGAGVYRGSEYLGITPVTIPQERGDGVATLTLKLDGFIHAPLEIRLDRDGDYNVQLEVDLSGKAPKPDPKKDPKDLKAWTQDGSKEDGKPDPKDAKTPDPKKDPKAADPKKDPKNNATNPKGDGKATDPKKDGTTTPNTGDKGKILIPRVQ